MKYLTMPKVRKKQKKTRATNGTILGQPWLNVKAITHGGFFIYIKLGILS